jgi:hypothetical protein
VNAVFWVLMALAVACGLGVVIVVIRMQRRERRIAKLRVELAELRARNRSNAALIIANNMKPEEEST